MKEEHLSTTTDPVSLLATFGDPDDVECVVTVPTYRRPNHLRLTLESLTAQEDAPSFAVVVIENDAACREGAVAAERLLQQTEIAGAVIVAHRRGNCHAYNAGWETALSLYPQMKALAVIDDDECAETGWLAELHETARRLDVDIVGGPQIPVFSTSVWPKARLHPVFHPPYPQTGRVPILYSSGNVLITRRVLETMPRPFLDPAFNYLGGGDSDFYRRCRNEGFQFGWTTSAPVLETMPERRGERNWLIDRSLRNGAISAILERRQAPGVAGHARRLLRSGLLLAASPLRALPLWRRTGSLLAAQYHFHVALGRFQAEFGRVREQYRNPEAN